MPDLFAYLEGFGTGESFTKSIIIVTDLPTGSTVTATKGDTVKTAREKNGEWWFRNLDLGEWTLKATLGGQSSTIKYNIDMFGVYRVTMSYSRVYGIERDVKSQSPEYARTDDAVGFTATVSVGTVPGNSDFDNVYPWSEIKRVNLPTSDIMVKIPKFYYNRWQEGTVEHIIVSDVKSSNTEIHPAFYRNGKELDEIYVGAYKTSGGNKSVSGVSPTISQTRSQMRSSANEKGTGWGLIDIACASAIQMLMLVEFANNNLQSVIGRGFCDSNPSSKSTGSTDSVPNLTGRPAGTDGKVDVVWRGIEGIWSNIWEWLDGINWKDGSYYVCNNQEQYGDDIAEGYELLSFSGKTDWELTYITEIGLDDASNKHVLLPMYAGAGSASTYYCDIANSGTGWRVARWGGYYSSGDKAGLFGFAFDTKGTNLASVGSRLMYIPQEVA